MIWKLHPFWRSFEEKIKYKIKIILVLPSFSPTSLENIIFFSRPANSLPSRVFFLTVSEREREGECWEKELWREKKLYFLYESNEENLFRQSNKNQAKHSLGIFSPQLKLTAFAFCYERTLKWCELSRRRVEKWKIHRHFHSFSLIKNFLPFFLLEKL